LTSLRYLASPADEKKHLIVKQEDLDGKECDWQNNSKQHLVCCYRGWMNKRKTSETLLNSVSLSKLPNIPFPDSSNAVAVLHLHLFQSYIAFVL
jgi:hypothetical protein